MSLVDQAREFLRALEFSVEEKDRNFLVAENPGLGGEKERTCVWVMTQEARRGRQMLSLEEEYLIRFKGALEKYRGARLHLLVDTMEGLSAEFRGAAIRRFGVRIQVPAWFFDMPFKHEVARTAASAISNLVEEGKNFEPRRVPQAFEREDGQGEGSDLVAELLREIDYAQKSQEPWLCFVVAPAGQGKSILVGSLFAQLYRQFQEYKNRHLLYPRPLPMLPAHIREAAGKNVMGLIDAFLRTDVASPATRRLFDWMIDNRFGLWMLDGLDEIITRDEQFFPYLAERITFPGSRPIILICLRDSLFQSSDELSDFLSDFRSVIRVFRLSPWDRAHLRTFAWIQIEERKPREGDRDTPPVAKFLTAVYDSPVCLSLASLPFYAGLLLKIFKSTGALAFKDETGLLELALTEMCRREYEKGTLREDLLPLPALLEWLEELAVVSYESGGVSIPDLQELADLLRALVTRQMEQHEEDAIVQQIVMAPFLTRSATSGRVELTHEILEEYLAGRRFLNEFKTNLPRFASRLSQRPWPPDSVFFRVLSQALSKDVARLMSLAIGQSLPVDGFRNLIQLLVMIEGGDAVLRAGSLILDGARLAGVRFHDLNLDGVSFRGCDLTNAEFVSCSLRGGGFEGAVLKNTSFTHVPNGALIDASFGNLEHFDSVVVGEQSRIDDRISFQDWIRGETGEELTPPIGPCPATLQMLHLFRKFVHVDGQGRRDWLDRRGVVRGKRVPGAPNYEDCVSGAIEFGYLESEKGRFNLVRRPTGPRYGEMVSFVKSQIVSPGIRSLLDSLCRIPGCVHVPPSA